MLIKIDWKEFFRPNITKVIIFLVLFWLGFWFFVYCETASFFIEDPILVYCNILVLGSQKYGSEIIILWTIYWFILSYLISSTIAILSKKFRKR